VFSGFKHLTLHRPLVVIDLETTGTDPLFDRVVEIALIRCEPRGRTRRRRQLVHPTVPIPAGATAVHGITDAHVAAPAFVELAPKLAAFIGRADLAGFNLRKFDLPLLMAEFDRAGMPMPMAGRSVVDAYELYLRAEPRTLGAAVRKYLGSGPAERHAAAGPDLPITPAELQRLCGWADSTGRFKVVGGPNGEETVVFAFGRHRGRPLVEVARDDAAYLHWMLGSGFAEDACELVRAALGEGDPRA
jgi:DNA polymerase-3 subunit epsilon